MNSAQHARKAKELLVKLVNVWRNLSDVSMCGNKGFLYVARTLSFNEITPLGEELLLLI